jgi:hypothetical protein
VNVTDTEEDPPDSAAETRTWWGPAVAAEGTVNEVVTEPPAPGWQEEVGTTRVASKKIWQGAEMPLTVTVTLVPAGPRCGFMLRPMAEAGDAVKTTKVEMRAPTNRAETNLPPTFNRRLLNIWAAPPLGRWYRAES